MTDPTRSPTTAAVVSQPDITAPDNVRYDGWTRERIIAFLESLVETASVSLVA
jgi:hypothetical protein